MNRLPLVSPSEARALVRAGACRMMDIREGYHLERTRIRGAVHVPLATLLADPTVLGADKPVIIVGHDERDEALAANLLRQVGYDARVVRGGVESLLAPAIRA
ncbi:MAG: rhodanese-like domain-containing protein [Thermoplasmatota archaeon]